MCVILFVCVCVILFVRILIFFGDPILYANRQLTAHVYYQEKNNATKKWKKNIKKKKIKKEKCAS